MKKRIYKTICIALVAVLCICRLNAQKILTLSASSAVDAVDYSNGFPAAATFDGKQPPMNSRMDWPLSWCGHTIKSYLGCISDHDLNIKVAARFTPADLVKKGVNYGDKLTKFKFIVRNTNSRISYFNIEIYQGSVNLTHPGKLVYEQSVPTVNIIDEDWTEVTLTTPVHIDISKELWLAYNVVSTHVDGHNHAAGFDTGPHIKEKGDLLLWAGTYWADLYTLGNQAANYDGNWLIEGFVEPCPLCSCDPVTNLAVDYTADCKAILTWDASPNDISYNIYNNGNLLNNVTTTSYTDDTFNPLITNTWELKTICEDFFNSPSVSVTAPQCAFCSTLDNVEVKYVAKPDDCSVDLSWEEPEILIEGGVTYADTANLKYRLGAYVGADMTACIRLTPVDFGALGILSDQLITHVFFAVGDSIAKMKNMQIRIWEGGTSLTNPGEEIITQNFTANWTDEDNFGVIELDKPHIINTTKELRIGWCVVMNPKTYPFVVDGGPVVENKGDIFLLNGVWRTVQDSYPGVSANFAVAAIVEKGEAIPPVREYNIYRDNLLIAEKVTGTTYRDAEINFNPKEPHSWLVRAVCLYDGESVPAGKTLPPCRGANIKENESTFSIKPNPAVTNITITAGNPFNKVEVVNLLGQTVVSQTTIGNTAIINISNLNNGIYFVRVGFAGGGSVQKLVKQ